jgi:hypothetical protein
MAFISYDRIVFPRSWLENNSQKLTKIDIYSEILQATMQQIASIILIVFRVL